MELIVISRPGYFKGEASQINRLFENGMELLHLRKPESHPADFRKLLKGISPDYMGRIAIHQHHDLAAEFNLRRFHYPERLRLLSSHQMLEQLQQEGFILSSSIHDLKALQELKYMAYVFYGPVFNSISKPGYKSVVAPDFRLPERGEEQPKIIALGGVKVERLEELRDMNFDGAAFLGAVWENGMGKSGGEA